MLHEFFSENFIAQPLIEKNIFDALVARVLMLESVGKITLNEVETRRAWTRAAGTTRRIARLPV